MDTSGRSWSICSVEPWSPSAVRGRRSEQKRRIACDCRNLQPRPGPSHQGLTERLLADRSADYQSRVRVRRVECQAAGAGKSEILRRSLAYADWDTLEPYGGLDAAMRTLHQLEQQNPNFNGAGMIDDFRLWGSRRCRQMGVLLSDGGGEDIKGWHDFDNSKRLSIRGPGPFFVRFARV